LSIFVSGLLVPSAEEVILSSTRARSFTGAIGDIAAFRGARHFAFWLGVTPREYSSSNIRRLV
jgi:transposase